MAKSLADQLLGAGLVDDKKVKQAKKEKRKQTRQQHKGVAAETDETQARLQQQREEKAERDRQLNLKRQEEENAKAMRAQVHQMLQQSKIHASGDVRFSFTDDRIKKIKQLYVTAQVQNQLARGKLAICADDEEYIVVPKNVADKIAERFAEAIIFLADNQPDTPEEDDPYKDFPIPDDLMW